MMRLACVALILFLAGCITPPDIQPPKTVPEQIEAAGLLVATLSDKIEQSTCGTFENKRCIDPTTPLMPDDAILAHGLVEQANDVLQATRLIPTNGVGDCLGQQKTQAACLALASSLLSQVQSYLIAKGAE